MKNLLIIILTSSIFLLVTCCQRNQEMDNRQHQKLINGDTATIYCDSIFKESGYFVKLISFDSLPDRERNSILIFGQKTNNVLNQLFLDTLYSMVGKIEFTDYNGDNSKDILIQSSSDARSNWTYHLFLTDFTARTLKKVKGFDKIKNPRLNKDLDIIESYVSSGTNYSEFYKLVDKDSIYKYDILVYDTHDEESSKNYKQALEKIRSR